MAAQQLQIRLPLILQERPVDLLRVQLDIVARHTHGS